MSGMRPLSRRKFLRHSSAGVAGIWFQTWPLGALADEVPSLSASGLSLPCCVGDVGFDSAVVWLRTAGAQSVLVEYAKSADFRGALRSMATTTRRESDFTAKILIDNLEPATEYFYRAVVAKLPPGPEARFVSAPDAGQAMNLRFAFSGDTRQSHQPFSIMDAILAQKPAFFLHLGDTIYGDREGAARTLAQYHDKYRINRRDEPTQRLFTATSVMVVWDDHEVADNYRAAHPLAPIGRRAFMDFWPVRQDPADPERIYRTMRWGKCAEFFILDTRQYRDETVGTILGETQKRWFLNALSKSDARFKFVCTSVPISSPNKDKWGGYPADRDEVLKTIRDKQIGGVIFLSADVHYAAVARVLDTSLREVITGPLAAPLGRASGRDKRFEYFNNQYLNYGLVNVHEDGVNSSVDVEIRTDRNVLLHKIRFDGAGNGAS
jgi:alkaline phosphatase D